MRVCAVVAIAMALALSGRAQLAGAPRFRLHTIDVGQGSATLVEAKCGAVLVDTGSGEGKTDAVERYLNAFFALRPDLNRTLEAVYITHSHIDHTRGLMSVVRNFKVKRVVTNGRYGSSGGPSFTALFNHIATLQSSPLIVEVFDSDVAAKGKQGLTNRDIDPLKCADCDPDVRIFFGSLSENPGWTQTAFNNANNHSLVIRVKLGSSTWLVTGDSEETGIARLLNRFKNSEALRATILTVGHHGSRNGTTKELLNVVKPRYALISCGKWNEGRDSDNPFTTFRFGHPNKDVLDLLQSALSTRRESFTVKAGVSSRNFISYTIKKGIYCTAWDGSLVTDAYASGRTSTRQSGIGR
jgi:competence protein ComEC